jgi:hypothetical protein
MPMLKRCAPGFPFAPALKVSLRIAPHGVVEVSGRAAALLVVIMP